MVSSWLYVLSLVAPTVLAGMYGQPVVNLDAKTFKTVMATEHAAMVAFVAPWCGHCKALGPEYTAAAQSLSPLIPFYAVDCDDDVNKRLCAEHQIQGFPTIKAFPRAGKGSSRDYQGERKKAPLVDYAKGLVPDRVKKLRVDDGVEKSLDKFLAEKPTLPHVLLVHPSSPSIPFLWKVLGHRLSSKIHFGFIRDSSSHQVLSTLGVYDPKDKTRDATRAVIWAPGETSRTAVTEYDDVLKFNALLAWMQDYLSGSTGENRNKARDEPHVESNNNNKKKKKASKASKAGAPDPAPEPQVDDAGSSSNSAGSSEQGVPAPEPEAVNEPVDGSVDEQETIKATPIHEEL